MSHRDLSPEEVVWRDEAMKRRGLRYRDPSQDRSYWYIGPRCKWGCGKPVKYAGQRCASCANVRRKKRPA